MVDGLNVHRTSSTSEASQLFEGVKKGSLPGKSVSSPPQGKAGLGGEKIAKLEVFSGAWQQSAEPSKSIRPDSGVTYVRDAYLDADSDLSRLYGDAVHEPVDQLQEKTSKKQELKTEAKRHLENAGVLTDVAKIKVKRHLTNAGVLFKAAHIKLSDSVSSLPGDIKTNLNPHNVMRSAKEVFNYLGGQVRHGVDEAVKPFNKILESNKADIKTRATASETRAKIDKLLSNIATLHEWGLEGEDAKGNVVEDNKRQVEDLQKQLKSLNLKPPTGKKEAKELIDGLINFNSKLLNYLGPINDSENIDKDETLQIILTQMHLNTAAINEAQKKLK